MRIFKIKSFARWARKEGLKDDELREAVNEIEQGRVEASLGGKLYKKRVSLSGGGKSGGARTLVAFQDGDKAFFLFGFAKNERTNISKRELAALKLMAEEHLGYSDQELEKAIKAKELIEVSGNDQSNLKRNARYR